MRKAKDNSTQITQVEQINTDKISEYQPDQRHQRSIPVGWSWVKLGDMIEKISTTGIKLKQKDYLVEGKYPVVDQGQELVGGYSNDASLIVSTELPIIIFGDHTKVKKFIDFKFIAGADGVIVVKPKKEFFPKLFFYFLHCIQFPDKGYARHFQYVEKSNIPLPPLPEQKKIVEKIEELFSGLDSGVASLKKAKEQIRLYRQSVLASAFSGKLTQGAQRQAHSELPDGWKWVKLGAASFKITDGEHLRPKVQEDGIPFLSAKDVRENDVTFENVLYVSEKDAEMFRKKCNPEKGDILIVSRGATVGRLCIIKTDRMFCLLGSVILIKIDKKINPSFIAYMIKTPQLNKQIINVSGSTAQQAIYLRDIKNVEIPVPPLAQQTQIVEEIEKRFSEADNLEKAIDDSLAKSEILRQSILSRAFSGKLV